MSRWLVAASLALSPVVLVAASPDPRLATVRHAFVTMADELGDGRPIAVCLTEHLSQTTPLNAVTAKDDADVILSIVRAKLPGNTTRAIGMASGGVELVASLPDGTKLWSGVYRWASVDSTLHVDIPCAIADGIANELRQAMRKARDKK